MFKPASPGRTALSTTGGAPVANRIIKLIDLPVGETHEFAAVDGQPAILFRTKNGVFAYSEICTHQGCTVSYSAPDKTLVCPCHSGMYDPFNGAAVIAGPPLSPLPPVKVALSGAWVVQA